MENDLLKQAFQTVHSKFVNSINPDPVMDVLFSKNIISSDQFGKLRHDVTFLPDRCRNLLTLLHKSSHPQTFIYLRLALVDDYPWIVDEIDKLLPPTTQLQQLRLDHTTDGINSSYREKYMYCIHYHHYHHVSFSFFQLSVSVKLQLVFFSFY